MADPRLEIQFGADLREIKAALGALTRDLQGLRKTAESAGQRVGAGLEFAKRAAFQLGTALGAAFSVRSLAAMSDEAATLNARLRIATKSTQEFSRAQSDLFAIAQRTRTGLSATVDLYARMERSTRKLNLSQATLLQLTETINKAGQLSGGGQGFENALIQFGQALQAGDLSAVAQEMNSIQEQAPRLAEAIVKGLKTLGFEGSDSLKKLVSDGGVDVQDLLRAILTQVDEVDKEFAQLPATISGGFAQIRNAFLNYISTSEGASTAARSVANALKLVADNVATIIDLMVTGAKIAAAYFLAFVVPHHVIGGIAALRAAIVALNASMVSGAALSGLAFWLQRMPAAFAASASAAGKAALAIRLAFTGLFAFFAGWQIGTLLREQFLEVELFGIAMVSGLLSLWERLKGAARIAGAFIKSAFTEPLATIRAAFEANLAGMADALEAIGADRLAAAARKAAAAVRPMQSAYRDAAQNIVAETAAAVARVQEEMSELADAAIAARQQVAEAGSAGEIGLGGDGGGAGAASAYRADLELLRDSIDRALAELERLYDEGEIGLREYFQRKQELQTQAIDAAIAQARHELAVADSQEAQAKALVEIEKLQRDRAEIGPAIAREQAKAEKELARSLEDVKDRLAELQGDTTASARRAIEREREELLRKFRDDPEAAQWIERLFNAETARTQLNAIRDEVQRTISDLRGTEDLLAAQVEAGQVMPHEAERQLQALREQSIAQLQAYREQLAALYEASGDPEVLRQLQAVDTEIARVAANMGRMRQQIADQAINSLTTFFTDLATGAKSAGEALRDFVLDFARGMAQIAAKALATYAVLQMLDAIYPGLGRATAAMSANVHHAGGVAGSGPTRRVDPLIFAAAPRFHSGGLPGLRPDEVPAILQRGEEVLSKGDPRNVLNGGGRTGPGTGTRVINVLDPSLVQDYMDSPAGEETVLNIIGRNPGRVKQIIA